MTKAIFFGTPEAATPALSTLNGLADIVAVVTQPDRPRGRSGVPRPPAVKEAALQRGLAVIQPTKLGRIADVAADADIGVLVAYGRIIPQSVLTAPSLGIVNLHFSILPRWRGASPVQHAILAGDSRSGVSLMQMDEGLDTGPVLRFCETIVGEDNAAELTERLAVLGADLLAASWAPLIEGALEARPQDQEMVTTAPLITAADVRISLDADAATVLRHIRAFSPRPGAWGSLDGGRFKVLEGRLMSAQLEPGVIDDVDGRPALGTGTSAIELVTVQPEGKAPLSADAWFNGRRRRPAVLS